MGSVIGGSRRGRSTYYDDHFLHKTAEPELAPDSLPYAGYGEVHNSPRRTTSRRPRRPSSSKTVAQRDYSASAMPPPVGATLTRAATVGCRRPSESHHLPRHRHSTRDASSAHGRANVSGHSRTYGDYDFDYDYGDGGDGDDHIEVIEAVEEKPRRHRERRQLSRDEYVESSSSTRHHRRRKGAHVNDDNESRRHYAASDGGYGFYASPKTPDPGAESRRIDVIEDSRPPVSSRRSLRHKHHTSAEDIHGDRPPPSRRMSSFRSSRSRAGSLASRSSSVISAMFGVSQGRQDSEKATGSSKKRAQCSTCLEDINPAKLSKLKCGHSMCRACLRRVFTLSISDPQHMPPRCCQNHIPVKHVDRLFDHGFKKLWNRKFAESSTKNRIYCPSRKCGEWIKPANIRRENGRKVARCGRCSTKVCCLCNGRWHGSQACSSDAETAKLLAQAQEEGWKRCFKCRALVELKEGCNHMTCRCGAEFCMICGLKWKKCDCPWFNPENMHEGHSEDILNVPIPAIRGDLGDIFHADGPPAPAELRGYPGPGFDYPTSLPLRHRPASYQEETRMRREQEARDAEVARHSQYRTGGYHNGSETIGGVGEIHGIGNASAHYMNENYRRDAGDARHYRAPPPVPAYSDAFHSRRRSDSRSGKVSSSTTVPIYPLGMMHPTPRPPAPAPRGERPRPSRHQSLEPDTHNTSPYIPRLERFVSDGAYTSRGYEAKAELRSPPSSKDRRRGGRESRALGGYDGAEDSVRAAKGSHLAGLSGMGSGKNRVSQWRTYVEPGIPDGESTIGHA
ncbi:hypothetical protein E4U51_006152 [Claviceps purpurea]|nr:hypothetical protein E4U51_006152 [Claviceps purpurea]